MPEQQPERYEVFSESIDMLDQVQLADAILTDKSEDYVHPDTGTVLRRADWFDSERQATCYLFDHGKDKAYRLDVCELTRSFVHTYMFSKRGMESYSYSSATERLDKPEEQAEYLRQLLGMLRDHYQRTPAYQQQRFDEPFRLLAAQAAAEQALVIEQTRATFPAYELEIYEKDHVVRRRINDELYRLACEAEFVSDKESFDAVLPTVVATTGQAVPEEQRAFEQADTQPILIMPQLDFRAPAKRRWLRFWR